MKKKFAISSIGLAILIVLMLGAIPHHHHGNGVACIFTAHCENDNSADDEHANQNAGTRHHDSTCIADANYYTNSESKVKIKTPSCDHCDHPAHIHLFPVLYLVSDFLLYPDHTIRTKPRYGEFIPFYTSADVSQFHGLRAPPFVLS